MWNELNKWHRTLYFDLLIIAENNLETKPPWSDWPHYLHFPHCTHWKYPRHRCWGSAAYALCSFWFFYYSGYRFTNKLQWFLKTSLNSFKSVDFSLPREGSKQAVSATLACNECLITHPAVTDKCCWPHEDCTEKSVSFSSVLSLN